MTDRVILDFINNCGLFEMARLLLNTGDRLFAQNPDWPDVRDGLAEAVEKKSEYALRIALGYALDRGVGSERWQAWCKVVIDWMDKANETQGDVLPVSTLLDV